MRRGRDLDLLGGVVCRHSQTAATFPTTHQHAHARVTVPASNHHLVLPTRHCRSLQAFAAARRRDHVPGARTRSSSSRALEHIKMSASLLQVFEQYQKARVQFVQAIAEAATRPQNIDTMQNAGVMQLLRPLLLDNVSTSIDSSAKRSVRMSLSLLAGPEHTTDSCTSLGASCKLQR